MAAYASLVSLMHIIDNLENHPHPPISLHKNQVHLLTQKITFLQQFLEGYNSPHHAYGAEADPLETRIADAAHAAEDVIESHIVDKIIGPDTMNLDMLFADHDEVVEEDVAVKMLYEALEKMIEEIALIEKEVTEIKQVQHQQLTKSTPQVSSTFSSSSSSTEKRKMVGGDELVLEMKDKLTSNCLALQIIPIVGMGGSGKTTLARNIYQDPLITEHFDVCAWVTISQEFSIREILVQLLNQLNKVASQDSSEDELGLMLHKNLFGRRYLIILDDMWNIEAWEGVGRYLNDSINGSRVVVTTRLSNLASELPNSNMLKMKLLDEADSWDLLSKTVFGDKGCPLELEGIGKKISKSCKGLPLSIVVVGGLLSKSEHTTEFWIQIEENLSSLVSLEDDERCLKTLHMSYKQLPVHLKPCFLYMGVYSEDEEIRISKLIKLWVAEGFIKPISGKSLEERAKECLKDLISRNLILICEWGIIGMMKYCKIHDLLRDLSLREAQKERFYMSNPQRRIVVSDKEAINALPSSMPLARSFLWHLDTEQQPPLLDFRLLRILQLQSHANIIDVSKCFDNIHQLVNSRFLNFGVCHELKIPESIGLFWNLQTIILHQYSPLGTVPRDIWYMPHLRHVWIIGFINLPYPPKDAIVLENLQALGHIDFKLSEQVVKIIPNIKKLSIKYIKLDDEGYCLNNLVHLDQLESLTLYSYSYNSIGPIHFPRSLKKLSLKGLELEATILDKIGELPLLQKLKLNEGEFKQGHWKTTEDQFLSLKYLDLTSCKIHLWTTESSHFPRLEKLHLSYLSYLEKIPLDFADITTLGVIELFCCPDSVVVSAKRIVEERVEIYGEEENLQVEVSIAWKNEALQSLAAPNFRIAIIGC